jgi:hypothetical protein
MTIRKTLTRALGSSALMLVTGAVLAADHADGPAASLDKTADIADLFSWAAADGKTTYFALDLGKDMQAGSKFSNAVKYVFHTASMPAYGAAPSAVKNLDIICTFDAASVQKASCWVGGAPVKDFVSGDASSPISSSSGKLKLFAGLRDDPFFFNLDGFNHVASVVHGAAGSLTFDASGCPALGSTGPVLAAGLAQDANGAPATDSFAAFNTLSIVLAVDTALVSEGGPIISVWASTNQ